MCDLPFICSPNMKMVNRNKANGRECTKPSNMPCANGSKPGSPGRQIQGRNRRKEYLQNWCKGIAVTTFCGVLRYLRFCKVSLLEAGGGAACHHLADTIWFPG